MAARLGFIVGTDNRASSEYAAAIQVESPDVNQLNGALLHDANGAEVILSAVGCQVPTNRAAPSRQTPVPASKACSEIHLQTHGQNDRVVQAWICGIHMLGVERGLYRRRPSHIVKGFEHCLVAIYVYI